jgi:hypothetical protein
LVPRLVALIPAGNLYEEESVRDLLLCRTDEATMNLNSDGRDSKQCISDTLFVFPRRDDTS